MGKLTGNAVTLDGETIKVTFESESVADGTLAHIVSINTQMDGSGEYSPLKITTASVSCLVDGAELMRLCVSEQPVSVIIENVEQESILFKGYVVPNSYNQALSGINDTITIECVDGLGYAKYVNYERGETFNVMTLADVLAKIIAELGIADVRIAHDVTLVAYDGSRSTRYDKLTLSDNLFYNINPEDIDGELLYEPVALTLEEVLRIIAESLRLTWVQIGDTLYLMDLLKIADERAEVRYRDQRGFAGIEGSVHAIDEEAFATTLCNTSSLPRYSRVVINHAEGGERAIQPALFKYEHLRQVRDSITVRKVDADERVAITSLNSMTYDNQGAALVAYKRFRKEEETPKAYSQDWDVCMRVLHVGTEITSAARCRLPYRGAVAPTAGRGIKVDIALRAPKTGDGFFWEGDELESTVMLKLRVSATSKGITRYYNSYSGAWSTDVYDNPIYFRKKGDEYVFGAELSHVASGNVIELDERGGVIDVELFTPNTKTWWEAVHVYKFDVVEAVVDAWAAEYPNPTSKKEARGQWKLNEVQEVSLPIDNYYYMTDKAFGNVIDGVQYKQILVAGEKLIDRVWHQANHGDRLMWEMALRDEANALSPLDAFTCSQLWSERKVVAGYARDIINNSITLTLI
jgi:hypothetical protein